MFPAEMGHSVPESITMVVAGFLLSLLNANIQSAPFRIGRLNLAASGPTNTRRRPMQSEADVIRPLTIGVALIALLIRACFANDLFPLSPRGGHNIIGILATEADRTHTVIT